MSTKIKNCESTIASLELNLQNKSEALRDQVAYNTLTLLMGMIIGFVFAKTYRFASFGKK